MTLVLVFLGLVLIRVLAVAIGAALIVRPARACPACLRATLPIHKRWLRAVPAYEWRWCPACGWQGIGRRERPGHAPSPSSAPPPAWGRRSRSETSA